jgi:hypothetical protein
VEAVLKKRFLMYTIRQTVLKTHVEPVLKKRLPIYTIRQTVLKKRLPIYIQYRKGSDERVRERERESVGRDEEDVVQKLVRVRSSSIADNQDTKPLCERVRG